MLKITITLTSSFDNKYQDMLFCDYAALCDKKI